MKAKKLLFSFALLIVALLLGCSNDDSYLGTSTGQNPESVVPTPNSPSGERKQILPIGATLNEINVVGENIRWYSMERPPKIDDNAPFLVIDPSEAVTRTLLPSATPLVNGATYFATQTVNNVESKTYLPVTVELRRFVR